MELHVLRSMKLDATNEYNGLFEIAWNLHTLWQKLHGIARNLKSSMRYGGDTIFCGFPWHSKKFPHPLEQLHAIPSINLVLGIAFFVNKCNGYKNWCMCVT